MSIQKQVTAIRLSTTEDPVGIGPAMSSTAPNVISDNSDGECFCILSKKKTVQL